MRRSIVAIAIMLVSTNLCLAFPGQRLLNRFNQPLVPTAPGLPVTSPLNLMFPRVSGLTSFANSGGIATPDGRRFLVGTGFPRVGNGLGIIQNPPTGISGWINSGLAVTVPRIAVFYGMLFSPGGASALGSVGAMAPGVANPIGINPVGSSLLP